LKYEQLSISVIPRSITPWSHLKWHELLSLTRQHLTHRSEARVVVVVVVVALVVVVVEVVVVVVVVVVVTVGSSLFTWTDGSGSL
jgi:hypothetical protein